MSYYVRIEGTIDFKDTALMDDFIENFGDSFDVVEDQSETSLYINGNYNHADDDLKEIVKENYPECTMDIECWGEEGEVWMLKKESPDTDCSEIDSMLIYPAIEKDNIDDFIETKCKELPEKIREEIKEAIFKYDFGL